MQGIGKQQRRMARLSAPVEGLQWRIFLMSLTLVILAACGGQTATTSSAPKTPEKVTVGTFGVLGDSAIYIGKERGYFKEQGIDLQITKINGSISDLVAGLATGKLDVGNGSVNAALYNAFGNNIHLKIVADNATVQPGHSSAALVVRKELANTVKTPADLKGHKIAVLTVKGSSALIYMDKILAPAGLTVKDVNLVAMPFPDMLTALANGAVDLAILVEPFLTLGQARNIFTTFKDLGEVYPNQEANVEIYTSDFSSRKDLANRFTIARLKGARDYYDAFFKNKNRAEIVNILTKYTSVTNPALYDRINFSTLNPNGRVVTASLQSDLDWYTKNGFVTKKVNLSSVVDNSFVDYATHTLGTYPPV